MFRRLLQEYPEIAVTLRARLSRNVMLSAAEFAAVAERLRTLET
jgi:hypothetical protein